MASPFYNCKAATPLRLAYLVLYGRRVKTIELHKYHYKDHSPHVRKEKRGAYLYEPICLT